MRHTIPVLVLFLLTACAGSGVENPFNLSPRNDAADSALDASEADGGASARRDAAYDAAHDAAYDAAYDAVYEAAHDAAHDAMVRDALDAAEADANTPDAEPDSPEPVVFDGSYTIVNFLDLQAFAGFTEITGDLTIQSTDLSSLSDLAGLVRVGGNLTVDYNSDLLSLDGLEALESVGGTFRLVSNLALGDYKALAALRSVGGDFWLGGNNRVLTLEGLEAFETVGRNLIINIHDLLRSLDFENLSSVGGYLQVAGNDDLPECAVDVLQAALIAQGWTGELFTRPGNLICPGGCNGASCLGL